MRARLFVQAIVILCLFTAMAPVYANDMCNQSFFDKGFERLAVRDQGCNPVCGWYARVSLFEESIFRDTSKIVNFSPEGYIAQTLTQSAIWRAEHKYENMKEDDLMDIYDRARFMPELMLTLENDWQVSPEFKNNSVERFLESVDVILKSPMPNEDKIENIKAASEKLFGKKKQSSNLTTEYKHTRLRVRNFEYWSAKAPITYDDMQKAFVTVTQETNVSNAIDILDKTLKNGNPVLVSLKWDERYENKDVGSLKLPYFKRIDQDKGNHAVLVYDKDWRGRYYFVNSWGVNVGKNGHYYVDSNYLKQAIQGLEFLKAK